MSSFEEIEGFNILPWNIPPPRWQRASKDAKKLLAGLEDIVDDNQGWEQIKRFNSEGEALRRNGAHLLAPLLLRCRLIDIETWTNLPTEDEGEVVPSTRDDKELRKKIPFLEKLDTWPDFVREQARAIRKISEPAPTPEGRTNFEKVFANFKASLDAEGAMKQITNWQIAALHLAWLLEGNPDLPDANTGAPPNMEIDWNVFESLLAKTNRTFNTLRQPLQIATDISPLCLFFGLSFDAKAYPKPAILQVWRQRGGPRSAGVSRIEKRLWRSLFAMARGAPAKDELILAFDDILPLLDNLTELDKTWFHSVPRDGPPQIQDVAEPLPSPLDQAPLDETPALTETTAQTQQGEATEKHQGTRMTLRDKKRTPPPSPSPQHAAKRGRSEKAKSSTRRNLAEKRRKAKGKTTQSDDDEMDVEDDDEMDVEDDDLLSGGYKRALKMSLMAVKEEKYPMFITLTNDKENLPRIDDVKAKKFMSKRTFKIYAPDKSSVNVTPVAHSEEMLKWLEDILTAVEDAYIDGEPPFINQPESSAFAILTREAALNMTIKKGQVLFRDQHIVVKGSGPPTKRFDEATFNEELGLVSEPRQLHDHATGNLSWGSFQDLIDSSRSQDGKLLNALDIPLTTSTPLEPSLSTHLRGELLSKSSKLLRIPPQGGVEGMHWGLAATSGTFHLLHIDTDGLATFVDVITGFKIWIVVRGLKSDDFLDDPEFFAKRFDTKSVKFEGCRFEAILLREGDGIRMQPSTLHAVITPQSSICKGGHFYAGSTLRKTFTGLYNCFASGRWITNTQHVQTSRFYLRHIAFNFSRLYQDFYLTRPNAIPTDIQHLPNIHTWDGMLDVLMLISFMELAVSVDFRSYLDGLQSLERNQQIAARRATRELRNWLWEHFDLVDEADAVADFQSVYWHLLGQQVAALVRCRSAAEEEKIDGDVKVSAQQLREKLESTLGSNGKLMAAWKAAEDTGVPSFGYVGERYTVRVKSITSPVPSQGTNAHETGWDDLDETWMATSLE